MTKSLIEFVDITTVDRSTAEDWLVCPRMAFLKQQEPQLPSVEMSIGIEVHHAISEAVISYLAEHGNMRPQELAETLRHNLLYTRPDLQKEAIDAAYNWFPFSWAKFICERSPLDIMRFDGGEGDKSGQLSRDIEVLNQTIRVTSEVDLLLATPSKQVVKEVDYKSGWTPYHWSVVHDTFQFRLHAWLIFDNYPEVDEVEVSVWETRKNDRSPWVTFRRADTIGIEEQISMALRNFVIHSDSTSADDVPAFPIDTKCSRCPFKQVCLKCGFQGELVASMIDELVVLEAASKQITDKLNAIVKESGTDLHSETGNCYGVANKREKYKPQNGLYVKDSK